VTKRGGRSKIQISSQAAKLFKEQRENKKDPVDHFPPQKNLLGAIDNWITREGNVKPTSSTGPTVEERYKLKTYYEEDVALLKKLFDLKVPWSDFV